VRLPFEYENLLTLDIIDFKQLQACQDASFRHAFAWPYTQHPSALLVGLMGDRTTPIAKKEKTLMK